MCTDGRTAAGGDREEVGDEEVVRQHAHRDQTASDEPCEPDGVRQGHLEGLAEGVRYASGPFTLILGGGATPESRLCVFRLHPNPDKGYSDL